MSSNFTIIEVDSPSATLIPVVPSENTEPITPKKEVEIETHTDNQDANLDKNLPKSPENDTTDTALSIGDVFFNFLTEFSKCMQIYREGGPSVMIIYHFLNTYRAQPNKTNK